MVMFIINSMLMVAYDCFLFEFPADSREVFFAFDDKFIFHLVGSACCHFWASHGSISISISKSVDKVYTGTMINHKSDCITLSKEEEIEMK